MASVTLTNLVQNSGFETNVSSWSGYTTNKSNSQSNLNPTRQSVKTPVHGESGSYALQIGAKTQGLVYVNPSTPITTVVGHKYYVRARVNLRGATAGQASVCTAVNSTTPPTAGVAPPPFSEGMQATSTTGWNLIDTAWDATVTSLNLRFVWQTTANAGNNDVYGQLDNVLVIDLTATFGAGQEPPLLAIRETVDAAAKTGALDGSRTLDIAVAPEPLNTEWHLGLKGREFHEQIEIRPGTGTAPMSYAISGLPSGHGLTVSSTGDVSGILNLDAGTYSMTVTVTDAIGYQSALTWPLTVGEPPVIQDTFLPGAVLGEAYIWSPTVGGSLQDLEISLEVTVGSLPTGLTISGDTILGTPTADGQSCQVTITAVNAFDLAGVSKTFTLTVASSPIINTVSPLPFATARMSYSSWLRASGLAPITWELVSGSPPPGMSFSSEGLLSGTPTVEGLYSASVRATNSLGSDTRVFTIHVYELPIILTTAFGYARIGTPYSGKLDASGSEPILWEIVSGTLPTGLILETDTGVIHGTPLAAGTFAFSVRATNPAGFSGTVPFSIQAGLALSITSTSPLPVGTVGVAYTPFTFAAASVDGSYPTTWGWAAQSGSSFPPGLVLNTTTGQLTGTPTTAGEYRINVTVTNGPTQATSPFVLTVGSPPTITTDSALTGGVDRPFTIVLEAASSRAVTWALTAGPSPSVPLTVSSEGVVTWLSPDLGTYTFSVAATNVFGTSAPKAFSLEITTPSIIDVSVPVGIVGEAYEHVFQGGGAPPFTWSLAGGTLPRGLSFDAGTLAGTPTTAGSYAFELRVDNAAGFAQEAFLLDVYAAPRITTPVVNSTRVGTMYSQILAASGTTPITWEVTAGALPNGLSLSGATLTGTPTTQGVFTFTVRASNIAGLAYADSREYTMTVGPSGAPVITSSPNLQATLDAEYSVTLSATGDAPLTWAVASGSTLPPGLSLAGDVLSGRPAASGTFSFTLSATNAAGADTRTFTLVVLARPIIVTESLAGAVLSEAYNQALVATGDPPLSWAVVPSEGGTGLPPGLALGSGTGVLSGTPTQKGLYQFLIQVTNAAGSDSQSLTLNVTEATGTYIQGKIIDRCWVAGKEIASFFILGQTVFEG